MHRPTLKTEGDVEFKRGLSVKPILEIYESREIDNV
jgi:hypothetical protein